MLDCLVYIYSKCQPPHQTFFFWEYTREKTAESLRFYFASLKAETESLKEVEVMVSNVIKKFKIELLASADMLFLCALLGHAGPSATNPCLYCYSKTAKNAIEWKKYTVNENTLRSEEKKDEEDEEDKKMNKIYGIKFFAIVVFLLVFIMWWRYFW